jgi:hypothetical protein
MRTMALSAGAPRAVACSRPAKRTLHRSPACGAPVAAALQQGEATAGKIALHGNRPRRARRGAPLVVRAAAAAAPAASAAVAGAAWMVSSGQTASQYLTELLLQRVALPIAVAFAAVKLLSWAASLCEKVRRCPPSPSQQPGRHASASGKCHMGGLVTGLAHAGAAEASALDCQAAAPAARASSTSPGLTGR